MDEVPGSNPSAADFGLHQNWSSSTRSSSCSSLKTSGGGGEWPKVPQLSSTRRTTHPPHDGGTVDDGKDSRRGSPTHLMVETHQGLSLLIPLSETHTPVLDPGTFSSSTHSTTTQFAKESTRTTVHAQRNYLIIDPFQLHHQEQTVDTAVT